MRRYYEMRQIYNIMKRDINKYERLRDNIYDIPLVNKKVPDLMKDDRICRA